MTPAEFIGGPLDGRLSPGLAVLAAGELATAAYLDEHCTLVPQAKGDALFGVDPRPGHVPDPVALRGAGAYRLLIRDRLLPNGDWQFEPVYIHASRYERWLRVEVEWQ